MKWEVSLHDLSLNFFADPEGCFAIRDPQIALSVPRKSKLSAKSGRARLAAVLSSFRLRWLGRRWLEKGPIVTGEIPARKKVYYEYVS
jgi:hypothetical protein